MNTEQLLSKKQVAARLGVSTRTVDRIVTTGDLTPIRVRRQIRFTEADLDAYIAVVREVKGR